MGSYMLQNVETEGNFNNSGLGMRQEDANKIIMSLIKTYSSKVTPVREVTVNGLEVSDNVKLNIVANDNKHNLLGTYTSAEYDSGVITVTDDGPGMTEEFMRDFLLYMGASTKDTAMKTEELNQDGATSGVGDYVVGGAGIGAKSPLSISNQVTWKSTNNGKTTVLVLSRAGEGTATNITSFDSDLPNGTTVTIPVDGQTVTRIIQDIDDEFLNYADPASLHVTINGEEHTVGSAGTHTMKEGEVRLLNDGYYRNWSNIKDVTIINTGNIKYAYQINDLFYKITKELNNRKVPTDLLYIHGKIIVRFNVPREYINPHRESLEASDELDWFIIKSICDSYEKQVEEIIKTLQNITTPSEWLMNVLKFNHMNARLRHSGNRTVENISSIRILDTFKDMPFATCETHLNDAVENYSADNLKDFFKGKNVIHRNNGRMGNYGIFYWHDEKPSVDQKCWSKGKKFLAGLNSEKALTTDEYTVALEKRLEDLHIAFTAQGDLNDTMFSYLVDNRGDDHFDKKLTGKDMFNIFNYFPVNNVEYLKNVTVEKFFHDTFGMKFVDWNEIKKGIQSEGARNLRKNPKLFGEVNTKSKTTKGMKHPLIVFNMFTGVDDHVFSAPKDLKEFILNDEKNVLVYQNKPTKYEISEIVSSSIVNYHVVYGNNAYSRMKESLKNSNVKIHCMNNMSNSYDRNTYWKLRNFSREEKKNLYEIVTDNYCGTYDHDDVILMDYVYNKLVAHGAKPLDENAATTIKKNKKAADEYIEKTGFVVRDVNSVNTNEFICSIYKFFPGVFVEKDLGYNFVKFLCDKFSIHTNKKNYTLEDVAKAMSTMINITNNI